MLSGIVSSTRKSFISISELHLHHKLRLVPGSETFPFWSNLTHLTTVGPRTTHPGNIPDTRLFCVGASRLALAVCVERIRLHRRR